MSRLSERRRVGWAIAAVIATGALAVAGIDEGAPRTNAALAAHIAADFACPVCDGQSVAESDVPVAVAIRQEIRAMVDAGLSRGQIRDALVDAYDEEIDLRPRSDGFVALVWVVPVAAAVVAFAGLAFALARWRRQATASSTLSDDDRELVAQALEGKASR